MQPPPAPPRLAERPVRGVLLVIAAGALFSVSDTIAKYLTLSLPVVEVAWFRYVTFMLLTIPTVLRHGLGGLQSRRPILQAIRGLAVVFSTIFFVFGLQVLPVAEATAINFVSPAFITALSIVFLGEKVGVRRWAAVAVGLTGVLIVVRPGSGAFQSAAIFPILTAACWAAAMIATRRIGGADRTATTLFWSASIGALVLTALLPFGWTTPTLTQVALGILVGLISSLGQWFVAAAYLLAAASFIAPFSYMQLIFATLMGYLAFGAVPDRWTLLGGTIIIGSGIYTAHRERVRRREAAARAAMAASTSR